MTTQDKLHSAPPTYGQVREIPQKMQNQQQPKAMASSIEQSDLGWPLQHLQEKAPQRQARSNREIFVRASSYASGQVRFDFLKKDLKRD